MLMNVFNKVKPYLFVLIIFAIPLLFIPVIKMAKSEGDKNLHHNKPMANKSEPGKFAIVIHGGAGNFTAETFSEETLMEYKKSLYEALEKGRMMLENGKPAVDVVVAVIEMLENDSLFNAGRGAVLTHEGMAELDASIMIGDSRNAGAVAGVRTVKNPIRLARTVMDSSSHVMLSGRGAEQFAKEAKMELVDNRYFITKKSERRLALDKQKHGTVGCVALDMDGNIVAGTSTGGMSNKKYGRIGDSPIIGAGTWADNSTCGISCTGWGEYFIRLGVAHEISSLMRYNQAGVQAAADYVIQNQLQKLGGYGGVIGLDTSGNVAISFNTTGMFRAFVDGNGKQEISVFK